MGSSLVVGIDIFRWKIISTIVRAAILILMGVNVFVGAIGSFGKEKKNVMEITESATMQFSTSWDFSRPSII